MQPHSAFSECSPFSPMGLNYVTASQGALSFPPAPVYSPCLTEPTGPQPSSYNPLPPQDGPSAQITQHFVRFSNTQAVQILF